MGTLKPGATLIHENVDGVVYTREVGSAANTGQVSGWTYDKDNPNFDPRTLDGRPLHDHVMDSKLWGEIHRAAKDNPTLQRAIDRVKIIYYLSKEDKKDKPIELEGCWRYG